MNVEELIQEADREELIWALLVEHQDGTVELHSHDWQVSMVVPDVDFTKKQMHDWLLAPNPVPCTDAVAASVDVLNYCVRCDPDPDVAQ